MSFPEEKRQHERLTVKLPVKYQIMSTEDFGNTLTVDISRGGLRILVDNFIAPETKLGLELNFVNLSKVITTFGKVVWSQRISHTDQYQAGISFLEMNQKDKEDILECLSTYPS